MQLVNDPGMVLGAFFCLIICPIIFLYLLDYIFFFPLSSYCIRASAIGYAGVSANLNYVTPLWQLHWRNR